MARQIDDLTERVNTIAKAQGAQYGNMLAELKRINERLDVIEETLRNIQAVLQPMAFMLRKIAGDNPDNNHERMGE